MITVICGTNRKNSKSEIVAKKCFGLIQRHTTDLVKELSMEELPAGFVNSDMYDPEKVHPALIKMQEEKFIPADKLVIVVPEYNGGLPGIFKLFIDAISIRKYADNFVRKKVFLIGVSAGRAGNTRGLDYLTNCLNYLKMQVHPAKLPLSQIGSILNENDEFDEPTTKLLDEQMKMFAEY